MRKFLLGAIVLTSISFAGCNNSGDSKKDEKKDTAAKMQVKPAVKDSMDSAGVRPITPNN